MKVGYVIMGLIIGFVGLITIWLLCGWVLILLGLVLFIYGLVASDPVVIYQQPPPYYAPPPQQPMPGQQYQCAYCGKPLTLIPQNQRWFCYSCGKYN